MMQTKVCKGDCGLELPLASFYRRADSTDGLQPLCKVCLRELVRKYVAVGCVPPESTTLVEHLLECQGIPCATGAKIGQPYRDHVAWSIVPLEAKIAHQLKKQGRNPNFCWRYTKAQMVLGKVDVHVLIAIFEDGHRRVFVVPDDVAQSLMNKAGISCAIGSHVQTWLILSGYENRYDIIEQARLKRSTELASRPLVA